MIRILSIIKNIVKKETEKPPLGRWSIETCNKKLNHKIDLANEDHCGPCGIYMNKQYNNKNKK